MSKASIILADYHRTRPIANELGTLASMKITKPAVVSESKLIGLWEDGGLALESEEELNVILDHMVHDGDGGRTTPMERIQAKSLESLGPEGSRIHAAMCKARLNLFLLTKCRPGLGWEVEDIWQQQKTLVVDEALSEMPEAKGFMQVREGQHQGYVPLADLEAMPKADKNYWPVREYVVWYANRM